MALLQSRGSVEGKGAHKGVDLGRTVGVFFLFWFFGVLLLLLLLFLRKRRRREKRAPLKAQPDSTSVCARICTLTCLWSRKPKH